MRLSNLASVAIIPALVGATTGSMGTDEFTYSSVKGYFLQDSNSTNPATFNYTETNFGLINQSYPDQPPIAGSNALTQWQQFAAEVRRLQQTCDNGSDYKVLFMGRHGEGYHNVAEDYYGTPAWDCYWSLLDKYTDAQLTANGVAQARAANGFWNHEIAHQKIPTPDSFWVSPLTRCLQTANITFSGVHLPQDKPFIPTVKELLREGISIHTCDHRSNKTYIQSSFPSYEIEPGFSETDRLWNGVTAETPSAQDARSQTVLDQIFSDPKTGTYASLTSHSGEIASILRVLGHIPFSLTTGAVIPVLVKAEKKQPPTTTVLPWTPSAHCTVPPLTSISNGPCVCPNSAPPVTTTFTTSRSTRRRSAVEL